MFTILIAFKQQNMTPSLIKRAEDKRFHFIIVYPRTYTEHVLC